jgi:16S rRNA (cytosine1402-N4)-methyltransferase
LEKLGEHGRLIAFDKDPEAISSAELLVDPRFEIIYNNFSSISQTLQERNIQKIDGILLDLGVSSPQIDDARRGFSFRTNGPLDMRMDTNRGLSASEWLATEEERTIAKVITDYGEERFAVQIAKAIVANRRIKPITDTKQLSTIVANAVRTREKGKDPATRTFQAIRIFINRELDELKTVLQQAFQHMVPRGRLVVLSFHSLEDRIVKKFMASKAKSVQPDYRLPIRWVDLPKPELKLVARIKPSVNEISDNPRARSVIMRVGERLAASNHDSKG